MSAGGAGGKGVWGRSGEVYEPERVDERDPNYDEDQVTAYTCIIIIIINIVIVVVLAIWNVCSVVIML